MPVLEWRHSDYPSKRTWQSCHMPEGHGQVSITAVLGVPREGMRRHTFVAANFFMLKMLNLYRNDLSVTALPSGMTTAVEKTVAFLQSESARVSIRKIDVVSSRFTVDVFVENLTGHKLPTAYPSRPAWLHFGVLARNERKVVAAGALNADDSIDGNDNDADPKRFEPHYPEIP